MPATTANTAALQLSNEADNTDYTKLEAWAAYNVDQDILVGKQFKRQTGPTPVQLQ